MSFFVKCHICIRINAGAAGVVGVLYIVNMDILTKPRKTNYVKNATKPNHVEFLNLSRNERNDNDEKPTAFLRRFSLWEYYPRLLLWGCTMKVKNYGMTCVYQKS